MATLQDTFVQRQKESADQIGNLYNQQYNAQAANLKTAYDQNMSNIQAEQQKSLQNYNEEAAKRFENLIKNDPKNGRLYVDLAECYVAMNRKQDAIKLLTECLRVDSRNSAVRSTLDKLQRN